MWIKLHYVNCHGFKEKIKRKKAAQTKEKWAKKKLSNLSKVQQYTRQQWKILILWMAFFTAFLTSWLLCISCHFRSNLFPQGPDGQSFWSGWTHMHTCALTHLLFNVHQPGRASCTQPIPQMLFGRCCKNDTHCCLFHMFSAPEHCGN